MTEEEWQACQNPSRMLRWLRRLGRLPSDFPGWFSRSLLPRKGRLFLAACCRRVWHCFSARHGQRLIEYAEGFAGPAPTEQSVRDVGRWFGSGDITNQQVRLLWGLSSPVGSAAGELRNIAGRHAFVRAARNEEKRAAERRALDAEALAQCGLLRDLFPFSPSPRCSPVDPLVLSLAQAAYEERDLPSGNLHLARLAVLSDALEEAGCADTDILKHLRSPGPHVRGCWALDLALGKE